MFGTVGIVTRIMVEKNDQVGLCIKCVGLKGKAVRRSGFLVSS